MVNSHKTYTAPQLKVRYPALDGLHGIAIIAVLAFHILIWISPKLIWGKYGVDLFFVLSGFLITEILLNTRNKANYFKNFYINRAFRILPIYYLSLFLFFVLLYLTTPLRNQFHYYSHNILYLLFYFQNWLYILHSVPEPKMVLIHFWSLSIEEHFYFIFPLLVFFITDLRKLSLTIFFMIAGIILFRVGVWNSTAQAETKFLLHFMTRIDSICFSCLIGICKVTTDVQLKKIITGFCITAILSYLFFWTFCVLTRQHIPHFIIMGYTAIASIFALVIKKSVNSTTLVSKIFNTPILKYFGKISYGVYIYHYPILIFSEIYIKPYLFRWISNYIIVETIFTFFILCIIVGISHLSYHYFELPIMKKRERYIRA
jgi:peptidoglycan/LPS O-acetylase OafA/YrhL